MTRHERATTSVLLTDVMGLHARPAVKLTKLAKTFAAKVELATAEDGPWVDAKSIVKVMAVRARKGQLLHLRAEGPAAQDALSALRELISAGSHEDEADAAGAPAGERNG